MGCPCGSSSEYHTQKHNDRIFNEEQAKKEKHKEICVIDQTVDGIIDKMWS